MTRGGTLALAAAAWLALAGLGDVGLWPEAERSLVDGALRGGGETAPFHEAARWLVRAGVDALGRTELGARSGFAALSLASALALAAAAGRALGRSAASWTLLAYVTLPLALSTARHATATALAQAAFTALFALAVAPRGDGASRALRWAARAGMLAVAWTTGGTPPARAAEGFEAIGHGAFPWTGVALLAVAALANADDARDEAERAVRAEALVTLAALLAALVLRGGTAPLCAGPLALALALYLDRGAADRTGAWIALLATVVHARDLALYPRPLPWADPAGTVAAARFDVGALLGGDAPPGHYALAALACAAPAFALALMGSRRWKAAAAVGAVLAAVCISRGAEGAWAHAKSPAEAWRALRARARARDPVATMTSYEPPALYAPTPLPRFGDDVPAVEWLLAGGPRWLVLDATALPLLNRAHRRATGRNVTVAGGRPEGWLLATAPAAGVASANPLDSVVSGARLDAPAGARYRALGDVRFGEAVVFEGVDVRGRMRPGATVEIGHHLRVVGAVPPDRRVFVHVDGPCARIGADHDPAGGRYPTGLWLPGDHVRDAYEVTVPWYCPRGRYAVWVGFFQGDDRVPVTRGAHDGAHRVLATTLDLR